jgi:hypothetical protein
VLAHNYKFGPCYGLFAGTEKQNGSGIIVAIQRQKVKWEESTAGGAPHRQKCFAQSREMCGACLSADCHPRPSFKWRGKTTTTKSKTLVARSAVQDMRGTIRFYGSGA